MVPGAGQRSPWRVMLSAAMIGIALYLVLDIVAQLLPPHYSPLSQAESDLAVGPYGYIMAVNFLNRGTLSILFLLGLREVLPFERNRWGYLLVSVWALGSAVLAFFPTDVSGPATLHGEIHLVMAIVAFLGGAFGELALSFGMRGDSKHSRLGSLLSVTSVISIAALAILLLSPGVAPHFSRNYGGAVERIFIGMVLAWLFAISAVLLKEA